MVILFTMNFQSAGIFGWDVIYFFKQTKSPVDKNTSKCFASVAYCIKGIILQI